MVHRAALARDAGVAVVEVDGRRLLVGFGAAGVRVLARVDGPSAGEPREGGRP
ncbi:MAG TPA: flagellar biosynthetic protein FliO [Anaeromyxobacteraceae bacterium]|nr:flagellar biosynthetic protein FliO [Anaeromyxobacteraceae bacterium]